MLCLKKWLCVKEKIKFLRSVLMYSLKYFDLLLIYQTSLKNQETCFLRTKSETVQITKQQALYNARAMLDN